MINPSVLSSQTTIGVAFLASFLIWVLFCGLVVLWFIDGPIKKEQALLAFISSLVVWVITEMIKSFFPIPRPFQAQQEVYYTITTIKSLGSFPSTHAAVAFALATAVWLKDKYIGFYFMIGAILVALGRVLSNVHYPLDVIVGGILGVGTAYGLKKLQVGKFIRKR